jgi:formate transporter
LAITGAGGIDPAIRASNPAIPKLIYGALFPMGLFLIVLFGGDLFTGNTMFMTVACLHGRITGFDLLKNWILVFISNFIGCLAGNIHLYLYISYYISYTLLR